MTKQIRLNFSTTISEKPKRIHYTDLSIDQKINVKANSAGFQKTWITHSLQCWKTHVGFIKNHEHHPEGLSESWYWHNKANKNRPWDAVKPGQLFRELRKVK